MHLRLNQPISSSLVTTIDASRVEIEAGRHGQVHGPDVDVEFTFEGSDYARRLHPGQSKVLGAPVTSSTSHTVNYMDNMNNLRPDALESELPPGGKMEVEMRLESGGVGSHGEGRERASVDDDMVSLGSCSEDEMLPVIANTEATLMEVDPPVAVVNGKPECSTSRSRSPRKAPSPPRGGVERSCSHLSLTRRRSRSLSPAGVITPTLAEGCGPTASAEATNDSANVPLIDRLTKQPRTKRGRRAGKKNKLRSS